MPEQKRKLSLCWGSMEGVAFEPFLQAAAQAGFDAVTLNSVLFEDALAAGLSERDIRSALDDHGLAVSGIDPLFNWLPSSVRLDGDDVMSRITQARAKDIFRIAHTVGADLVNAPLGLATPQSEQEIVDCFGILCQQAAAEGLRVSLEFMPFNPVSDLATAMRIVDAAGQDNGGVMLDCWHLHRSGGEVDAVLEYPGEKFFAIQLDDAATQAMDDVIEETLNHRLLPGEGCIDLVRLVRNLDRVGADLVYDVEVFKASLREKPAEERAAIMFDSARQLLQAV